MFSSRLPGLLRPNALTAAVAHLRAAATPVIDLTETNPTVVGLPYPANLAEMLADDGAARYRPDPRGWIDARTAVANACTNERVGVDPDNITLAPSTSDAYSTLFKLLCDPEQDVLVPQPSYPLFELLTRLDNVRARPYRLDMAGRWAVDRASFERALTPATRAILVVSPNNPTGSMLSVADRDWLVDVAARREIAIIADEVFTDYPLQPLNQATSMLGESRVLTFVLGGVSKSCGLPQMKLAWILASGPAALVAESRTRLDLIADTYLSVSTPIQLAAPRLLAIGHDIRRAIRDRLSRNLSRLREVVAAHPFVTLLEPEGGWSAVLRLPATEDEETLVVRLLENDHVLVHPGYFFDFAEPSFLVLSLLPRPDVFDEGIARICASLRASLA